MRIHRPLCPEGRAAEAGGADAPCAERARPFVLAATILASAMAFIDGTVVHIALPSMQADLDASFGALQWVVNAYTLFLGALILVGGGLGDRLGRRRVFLVGLLVFSLASIACAMAPDSGMLIAARAAQGVGAALLVPQSLAILSASFPREVRGRAIGTWAAASAITTALGPVVGGLLIDTLGWRAAFWINLPLSVVAVALTLAAVPESRNREAEGPVDWTGAVLATLSIGAITYGLTAFNAGVDRLAAPLAAMVLGAGGLLAFLWVERRAANPLMPPSLFRGGVFLGANVLTVFLYGALAGALFLLPFELIARRGLSAAEAGLTMLPIGLLIGALSRRAGDVADRVGPRPLIAGGSMMVTLACLWLAVGPSSYWFGILAAIAALSAGMAAVVSPLTTTVMNAVPDSASGAASGVNNAASRLAGLMAVAVLGTAASLVYAADGAGAARFGALPPIGDPARAALEESFRVAFSGAMLLAATMAAAAAITAWAMLPRGATPPGGTGA